jgi:cell wall-associated NlpC family hydrolase
MTTKALCGIIAAVIGVVLACAAGGAILIGAAAPNCLAPSFATPPTRPTASDGPPATSSSSADAPIDCPGDGSVLARAATWLTAWAGDPVPYLSSADPATWLNGYRRDCSGYASMALDLAGPGLTTAELAARSTPITQSELHPGDLLINPAPDSAGHVVIFDRWTDDTMTSYLGYEQSGDGGTHHRVIPYPYFANYPMQPYRF